MAGILESVAALRFLEHIDAQSSYVF